MLLVTAMKPKEENVEEIYYETKHLNLLGFTVLSYYACCRSKHAASRAWWRAWGRCSLNSNDTLSNGASRANANRANASPFHVTSFNHHAPPNASGANFTIKPSL